MKKQTTLAIGAAIAVLLGLSLGLLFGAGPQRPKAAAPPVAASREPDRGLQVVVSPTPKLAKAVAVKPSQPVALPSPAAQVSAAASSAPVAPSAGSGSRAAARPARVAEAAYVRPAVRPASPPPARALPSDEDEDGPAYRPSPRWSLPDRGDARGGDRFRAEQDDDDDEPPRPPPPPPY